ncbi:MAG TPA: M20 family metallopeptidase [Capsulimonadaceae bacterium]|jgi:amidohydrolase
MKIDTAHLKSEIAAITADLIATRHYLHAHPEPSGFEADTAAFVATQLATLGLDSLRTGVGGHGVIAELRGDQPGPTVALRADMDALPILEQNQVDYCSTRPGVMHACGHDGHTTILLGAARILSQHLDAISGTIRFIVQPAEENVAGALKMCADGALDGVDAIFGLHGWPDLEVGQIGILKGPMMAAVDDFDIEIGGRGGHAAYPHRTVDPIVVGARIVDALQGLVSREIDPFDHAVVSVTKFVAGTTNNVIPSTALLSGTIRTLSGETRIRLVRRFHETVHGIATAAGATAIINHLPGPPPVINDDAATDRVGNVGAEAVGDENVIVLDHPSMGGEDFAVYLERIPGSFFRLGLGDVTNLHTPTFDFTDGALPVGVEMMCRLALG